MAKRPAQPKTHVQIAERYEQDVIAGKIPAGKWVRLACARNQHDRRRNGESDFPFVFDEQRADHICRFAELLPYVSGRGFAEVIAHQSDGTAIYRTITLQPWQVWFLVNLFGWAHRTNGTRRYRVALLLVPRKNGKSTLGAIIALYMLLADHEPGAQVYSAATTRDQAKAVAEVAWEMVKRSPRLRDAFGVKLGSITSRSLAVQSDASKFMPLSADANTLDGLNTSCAIIDELHAHKTADVWNVIDTSTSARQQPLICAITTAGSDTGGICYQKRNYLQKILDGVASDETYFGIEYGIDEGDNWKDPEIARKANPNYGVSVQPDDIQRKVHAASYSQESLNQLMTKHFNVWIRSESAWMTATTWQQCARGVRPEMLRAVPCWIGIDLGEVRDFSAIVCIWKKAENDYAIAQCLYVPEQAIAGSPIAGLSGWAHQGHLIVTQGEQADYERIKTDLLELVNTNNVKEIDFDRRSARLMIQQIKIALEPRYGRERVDDVVIDVPQSIDTMDPAMKTAERLVSSGGLSHDGNPAMAWMISNIVIERNHKGEIYPRKAGGKDSANKIDGPVAFFTALSRAMRATVERGFQMPFFVGGRK